MSGWKTDISRIKKMKKAELKAALLGSNFPPWNTELSAGKLTVPAIQARLVVLTTVNYGYKELPYAWFKGVTAADIRVQIAHVLKKATNNTKLVSGVLTIVDPEYVTFDRIRTEGALPKLKVIAEYWVEKEAEVAAAKQAGAGSAVENAAAPLKLSIDLLSVAPLPP